MILNNSSVLPRVDLNGAYHEFPPEFRGINELVLPEFDVPNLKGVGARFPRERLLALHQTFRAARASYNVVDDEFEDFNYKVDEHGLEMPLSDRERKSLSHLFAEDTVIAQHLTTMIQIRRERTVSQLLFNATTWPASGDTGHSTASTGGVWSGASATPITDAVIAHEKIYARCGRRADTMVIPWEAAIRLSLVTQVSDRLRGSGQSGPVAPETDIPAAELAKIFNVKRVLIADMPYNTAAIGQTATLANIWTKTVVGLYVTDSSPNLGMPCVGRQWRWSADDGPLGSVLFEQYRKEEKRGDHLRARFGYGATVLDSACGYLISAVLS